MHVKHGLSLRAFKEPCTMMPPRCPAKGDTEHSRLQAERDWLPCDVPLGWQTDIPFTAGLMATSKNTSNLSKAVPRWLGTNEWT